MHWQKHIPHITWGQWGSFNKSEFNTAKMAQFYPVVLTWSEFIFDMHKALMVNGHYTKYELTFSYSYVRYHKNTQQLWQNRHKYPILTKSQSIYSMHRASMMADHCTQHEQNPLIHFRYIYITAHIQSLWNNGHRCYILAHSQGIVYIHEVSIVVAYCTKYD